MSDSAPGFSSHSKPTQLDSAVPFIGTLGSLGARSWVKIIVAQDTKKNETARVGLRVIPRSFRAFWSNRNSTSLGFSFFISDSQLLRNLIEIARSFWNCYCGIEQPGYILKTFGITVTLGNAQNSEDFNAQKDKCMKSSKKLAMSRSTNKKEEQLNFIIIAYLKQLCLTCFSIL